MHVMINIRLTVLMSSNNTINNHRKIINLLLKRVTFTLLWHLISDESNERHSNYNYNHWYRYSHCDDN